MQYKIYLITNTVNGKKYVGQTKGKVSRRWTNHKSSARRGQDNYFYRAIRKYGEENFEVVTLEDWNTLEETNDAERWWIKILDTTNSELGYNGLIGGHFQPSPDVGKRISEGKLKAFQEHPEERENIRQGKLGVHLSEEHKKAIADAQRGQPTRRPGYHPTEETKAKTKATMLKRREEEPERWKGFPKGPLKPEDTEEIIIQEICGPTKTRGPIRKRTVVGPCFSSWKENGF